MICSCSLDIAYISYFSTVSDVDTFFIQKYRIFLESYSKT